jgi:hypothetical protein
MPSETWKCLFQPICKQEFTNLHNYAIYRANSNAQYYFTSIITICEVFFPFEFKFEDCSLMTGTRKFLCLPFLHRIEGKDHSMIRLIPGLLSRLITRLSTCIMKWADGMTGQLLDSFILSGSYFKNFKFANILWAFWTSYRYFCKILIWNHII